MSFNVIAQKNDNVQVIGKTVEESSSEVGAFEYMFMKNQSFWRGWPIGWGPRAQGAVFLGGGDCASLYKESLSPSLTLPSCLPEEDYQVILVP